MLIFADAMLPRQKMPAPHARRGVFTPAAAIS